MGDSAFQSNADTLDRNTQQTSSYIAHNLVTLLGNLVLYHTCDIAISLYHEISVFFHHTDSLRYDNGDRARKVHNKQTEHYNIDHNVHKNIVFSSPMLESPPHFHLQEVYRPHFHPEEESPV
jgi:hypothetical protein